MTAGSSMHAMVRIAPPQAGQVSMPIPKTRSRRCAQGSARHGVRPLSAPSDPLSWHAGLRCPRLAAVTRARYLAVRRKHPVEARQVDPRFGHQGRQTGNEVQRLEDDVRGAVSVRPLQLVADVAVRRLRQALFRDGAAAEVADPVRGFGTEPELS